MFVFFDVIFMTCINYVKQRFVMRSLLLLGVARRSWLSTFREICSLFPGSSGQRAAFPFYMGIKRVKFTLEQATKAQRGSRGIALLFL
jgi:hypothetical protein